MPTNTIDGGLSEALGDLKETAKLKRQTVTTVRKLLEEKGIGFTRRYESSGIKGVCDTIFKIITMEIIIYGADASISCETHNDSKYYGVKVGGILKLHDFHMSNK